MRADIEEKLQKIEKLFSDPIFGNRDEDLIKEFTSLRELPEDHNEYLGKFLDVWLNFLEKNQTRMDGHLADFKKIAEDLGHEFNDREELVDFMVAFAKKFDEYLVKHGKPSLLDQK